MVRASTKSIQARSQNIPLFMAGLMRMHRDLALTHARSEKKPDVKFIQIQSARHAHREYLAYLRMSA